ncbi:hypothetical protein BGV68_01940 [Burkholderia ubonensis]|uniref:hypothetical protein n=1 Tax=Burkholderia ubonensis TaxID=101571 RepID=UPI0008FDA1AF|nr:hypothetical protein [Burkholderia ubonensis]OJA63806.1 hypothetical protein BGV68_01940 [Burkholderia ubonensis]
MTIKSDDVVLGASVLLIGVAMWHLLPKGSRGRINPVTGTLSPIGVAASSADGTQQADTITSTDNTQAEMDAQVASTLVGPNALLPDASVWLQKVGGPTNLFHLPDQVNPNQEAYAGFDNPDNYG